MNDIEFEKVSVEAVDPYLERNRQQKTLSYVQFRGRDYAVFPGVFAPQIFEDTFFFAEFLPVNANDSVMEIGTGVGLIAINCALRGARSVFCTDISPTAVQNTLHNAEALGVGDCVKAECCDVFPNVAPDRNFDVIFWNVPFIYRSTAIYDMLARSVFDFQYQGVARYVSGVLKYLSSSGQAYLGFSPTTGDVEQLEIVFSRYGCVGSVVEETELDDGFVLQIIKLSFAE